MKNYTVIGFWTDTDQRFATVLPASTAALAEAACLTRFPGLGICGVLEGSHTCIDTSPLIAYDSGTALTIGR